MTKEKIVELVNRKKDIFTDLSDRIWDHPETGLEEIYSSEAILEVLKKEGFETETGLAGIGTAFKGTWGSGHPVIGFLGEYDALAGMSQRSMSIEQIPEKEGCPGHGCGHNLLAVGGIQAAVALKKLMEAENLKGTLKVFGTPAEEICVGKPFMARAGCFDGLDAVVDWHPSELNRPGYRGCLAYFNVKYHFTGKAAHGNAPWRGVSALDSAMLMGHAIELIREHIDPGPEDAHTTVNYAFPDCNNAYPVVVPDRAIIWVVGRFYKAEILEETLAKIRNAAEGCAKATGTQVREEFLTATHNMIPNKTIGEAAAINFEIVGAPPFAEEDNAVAKEVQESMGCAATGYSGKIEPITPGFQPVTDSSEYSWFAPMNLLNVSLSPSVETASHNWAVCRFAGSENGMKTAVTAAKVLCLTAYDLLTDSELLAKAQEEHKERLGGQEYKTMLPDDCMPEKPRNKKGGLL